MAAIKPLEELSFSDNFMFNQVMQNDKICIKILERLLKIEIDHIERVELEKEIKPYYQSKSVRLDVYIKDSDRVFDIEMQRDDFTELPRRLRYYQSMVDANALLKGQAYSDLNDSYIIFICKSDPLGKDLPVYSFLETCQEEKSILLRDGTYKFFFNADAAEKEKDVEIRHFLNYIKTGTADDELTKEIDSIITAIKVNEAVKEQYMFESIAFQDERRAGRREQAIENAIVLIKDFNVTPEVAAQKMNAPLDKLLEALKEEENNA